jgi:hypothetical protein
MTFPFVNENNPSRHRLETVVRGLSAEDFSRTTPYGWTIAALLAHMAFWDQRMLVLLRRWKADGVDQSPVDANMTNDALRPLCHALDPRVAADLCLSAAQALDAELETLTPEFMAQIEAGGTHFRMNRALHRNDHLKDIELLVQSRP